MQCSFHYIALSPKKLEESLNLFEMGHGLLRILRQFVSIPKHWPVLSLWWLFSSLQTAVKIEDMICHPLATNWFIDAVQTLSKVTFYDFDQESKISIHTPVYGAIQLRMRQRKGEYWIITNLFFLLFQAHEGGTLHTSRIFKSEKWIDKNTFKEEAVHRQRRPFGKEQTAINV